MNNADIAGIFEHIGKILELQGESIFRIRAYERASQTIYGLTQELSSLYESGGRKRLMEIPGIGQDLSLKIEELVKTGKLKYVEQIGEKIPGELFEIMKIPGMGPKKTKYVWEKFGVKNIAELQKLLTGGKLEKEKGWGQKSIAKIIEGIATKEGMGSRMPMPLALELAEEILNRLKSEKACLKIEIAGSLRRRKETTGDIDLLVASNDPEKMMDVFCSMSRVQKIIARGPTKSSVIIHPGIQSDLRVVDLNVFGAALHYFTGNKDHNIKIRQMAQKKGLTLNEYGMFKGTAEKKGKLVACKTEEDVFKSIGLPWIPPELREDRGEVDAAMKDELPVLIEEKDLKGDLHLHSNISDGGVSMTEMAKTAKERGFEYLAVTDHASAMGMVKGVKDASIKSYLAEVQKARKNVPGIEILAGAEVDIGADGTLYLKDATLKQLDWVVASVHQHFTLPEAEQTERLLKAIANPYVCVIGHPLGRMIGRRPGITFEIDTVFKAVKARGIALELNCSPERLDLPDTLVRRAVEMEIPIILSSDSHSIAGFNYVHGISQAKRAWVEKKHVLNAQSKEKFLSYLRKQKGIQ